LVPLLDGEVWNAAAKTGPFRVDTIRGVGKKKEPEKQNEKAKKKKEKRKKRKEKTDTDVDRTRTCAGEPKRFLISLLNHSDTTPYAAVDAGQLA
jgi:hypothetical protein